MKGLRFDTRTPVPESAEYKALTSTGKLRDISNPELVTAVTAVYEQLPYLQHLADESAKGAWNLRVMIATGLEYQKLGEFDIDMPAFTLNDEGEERLARTDVRALIVVAAYSSSYQAMRYRQVISEIEIAIASIEVELH